MKAKMPATLLCILWFILTIPGTLSVDVYWAFLKGEVYKGPVGVSDSLLVRIYIHAIYGVVLLMATLIYQLPNHWGKYILNLAVALCVPIMLAQTIYATHISGYSIFHLRNLQFFGLQWSAIVLGVLFTISGFYLINSKVIWRALSP